MQPPSAGGTGGPGAAGFLIEDEDGDDGAAGCDGGAEARVVGQPQVAAEPVEHGLGGHGGTRTLLGRR